MRVLAVSDFHGSFEAFRQVSFKAKNVNTDVIVISGDITHFGSVQNANELLLGNTGFLLLLRKKYVRTRNISLKN